MDELRQGTGDLPPPAHRSWMLRYARAVRTSVRAGRRRLQRARRAIRHRAALEGAVIRFGGRVCTAAQVGAAAGALAAGPVAAGGYPPVRFVGRGLTVVNLVLLTLLFADVLGASVARLDLLVSAAGLAGCTVAVSVIVALDVGRRLRLGARAWPIPEPSVHALTGAGLLMVLGGLTGTAAMNWALDRGSGPAVVAAGLILGTAALAGPLAVLADEVYGAGADGRRLARAERALTRWHRRARRAEQRARRHLDAADRAVWRAECALAPLTDLLGSGHRILSGLAAGIACLRDEAREARQQYENVVAPVAPEDLDLAG